MEGYILAKTKKQPLKEGDTVWIESVSRFNDSKRAVAEFIVVEANKYSAYVVRMDQLERYRKTCNRFFRSRIDQRRREMVENSFEVSSIIYDSLEDFENDDGLLYKELTDRR